MILLANMRVEQLPQAVLSIETDQEPAVTDRYVSGHDDLSWVKHCSKKSTPHALYLIKAMPCNGNFSEIRAVDRHLFFANSGVILSLHATVDEL